MKENNLHEQLEFHRNSLKQVDESIKKLNFTESDLTENNPKLSINQKRRFNDDKNLKRKSINGEYESDDEDKIMKKKPTLQSSVISKSINVIKSKEDLIKIQNKQPGSEQRNKRILGVILGTLKQFKTEDKERSSTTQAQNRKELEKKIEIKKIEEKNRILEEKRKLETEKYKSLRNIELIERKIALTEGFEAWKNNHKYLKNFIRSKTKPFLFYLPKVLDEKSEKLLDESFKMIENEINQKQTETENELNSLNKELSALNEEDEQVKSEQDLNQSKNEDESAKDNLNQQSQEEEVDLEEDKNNVRIGEEEDEEETFEQSQSQEESQQEKQEKDLNQE